MKHRNVWPLAWLCETLDVSCSGFHVYLRCGSSLRAQLDEELPPKIGANFLASARTYGARCNWHDVLAEGASRGLHRIERLMRENVLLDGRELALCLRRSRSVLRPRRRLVNESKNDGAVGYGCAIAHA